MKLVFLSERAKKKCSISTPFWRYIVDSCEMFARLHLRYTWLGPFFYKGFQSLQTCKIVDPPYFCQGPFVIFLQEKNKNIRNRQRSNNVSCSLVQKRSLSPFNFGLISRVSKVFVWKKNRAILTPKI